MWLLFHRNAKTRVIRDGRSFLETCPECERRVRFDEVEVSESFGVFFVDLVSDKERKYRCSACGDVFDLRDEADQSPPAQPATRSAPALARERAAAEARLRAQDEQRRAQSEAKANQIEDELAELKKRLGR